MVWHVKNTRLFIEMKRILFIAPASFPVTGAENIVNIKLLQALSKSGDFEIDLVSKRVNGKIILQNQYLLML